MKSYATLGAAICLTLATLIHADTPLSTDQSMGSQAVRAVILAGPKLARIAAQNSLREWVDSVKAEGTDLSENSLFDLKSLEEVTDLKVGPAIRVALVDDNAVLAGQELESSVHASSHWMFVVSSGARGVGVITVAETSPGDYETISLGSKGLGGELQQSLENSDFSNVRIVRSMKLQNSLLRMQKDGTDPTYYSLGQDHSAPKTSTDVQETLHAALLTR